MVADFLGFAAPYCSLRKLRIEVLVSVDTDLALV